MDDRMVYQVFECASAVFSSFIVHQYITAFFKKRFENRNSFLGYMVFSLGLMLLNLICREPIILITYTAIGIFILESLFYKTMLTSKLFSILFFAILMITSEIVTAGIISVFGGVNLQDTKKYSLIRVVCIVIAKLIQILIVKLTGSIFEWKKDETTFVGLKQVFPLFLCQVFSIILAYHVIMLGVQIDSNFGIDKLLFMIGILYVNVIIFWYFDRIRSSYEYKIQIEAAETRLELQKRYYKSLDEHHHETNALWHDMRKHLTVVKSLLDKNEDKELEDYVNELESQVRAIPAVVRTTQPIISALLTEEMHRAKEENIDIEFDIRLQKEIKVNPVDLCVILSNIFENAFEACSQLNFDDEKLIEICIAQKGTTILIEVRNTYRRGPKKYKHRGRHGYGLKNVQKVVDKYDGEMDIYSDDRYYCISIIIP